MRLLDPRNSWAQRYGWLVTVVPLCLLFSVPLWWWLIIRPVGRTSVVVDKTVPGGSLREHESLGWVLNHLKAPWGEYVGAHFLDDKLVETPKLTRQRLAGATRVFLCDSYGIYRGDEKDSRDLELLDGGLDEEEISALEEFVGRGGRLYGEFNCLAFPVVGARRQRLEKLFGVHFTGWTGRFFPDLADPVEVPEWMRRRLKLGSAEDWNYSGPGYVLLHEDGRLVVLAEQQDVHPAGLTILLDKPLAGCSPETPFSYWFDVMQVDHGSQLLASFHFSLTVDGRRKLKSLGLKSEFPAILSKGSNLYCCGDFSDNDISRGPYWLEGWPTYCKWRYRDEADVSRRFFWTFYVPLIEGWLKR